MKNHTPFSPFIPGGQLRERGLMSQLWPLVTTQARAAGIALTPLNRKYFAAAVLPAVTSYVAQWKRFEQDAAQMSAALRSVLNNQLEEQRAQVRSMVAEFGGSALFDDLVLRLRNQ